MSDEGRVLWLTSDDDDGLDRITLFTDADAVALRTLFRQRFHPSGPNRDETWVRRRRGDAITFSLRRGRLDLYQICADRRRRTRLANWSTFPGLPEQFLQRQLAPTGAAGPDAVASCLAPTTDALVERARTIGLRVPGDPYRLGVRGTVAALAYPLLGDALDAGFGAPDRLPTSISPVLRRTSARDGAAAAFGAKATRRVVRELARSLLQNAASQWSDQRARVRLLNLEVAVVARSALTPDHIADLLSADSAQVSDGPGLTADEAAAGRRLFAGLHPRTAYRLALDAIEHPHGAQLLADTVKMWRLCDQPDPKALPHRLVPLHDALAAEARDRAVPDLALDAYPPEFVALDGARANDMTLVVPKSTHELIGWGREMENCIGAYAEAAWCGRTWLIGVERDGALLYNLEVDHDGGVTQFTGHRNRAPDRADERAVLSLLRDTGQLGRARPCQRRPHPEFARLRLTIGALMGDEPF